MPEFTISEDPDVLQARERLARCANRRLWAIHNDQLIDEVARGKQPATALYNLTKLSPYWPKHAPMVLRLIARWYIQNGLEMPE